MRTHTGENYHACPYEDCGKRYAHEYKLRAHMRNHHDKVCYSFYLPLVSLTWLSADIDYLTSKVASCDVHSCIIK
jgi:hypothetical protein